MDWFKILSLGGTKTVIKSWFGDAGCSISYSILDLLSCLFVFYPITMHMKTVSFFGRKIMCLIYCPVHHDYFLLNTYLVSDN